MTPERIEEIKALFRKIDTGWNWRATVCEEDGSTLVTMGPIAFAAIDAGSRGCGISQEEINKLVSDTAGFVASSRYIIPELLAEMERLERDCVDFRIVTKAINEACTCGRAGPGKCCSACRVWNSILIERSKPSARVVETEEEG
ncbi:MAG: hypothetical protein ACYTFK_13615 [Planctomycetota bacterium]|jgi:hypothetical protein